MSALYKVGEKIEYLLHTQPDKWKLAIVLYVDERFSPPMYTVQTEGKLTTQQSEKNMRGVLDKS